MPTTSTNTYNNRHGHNNTQQHTQARPLLHRQSERSGRFRRLHTYTHLHTTLHLHKKQVQRTPTHNTHTQTRMHTAASYTHDAHLIQEGFARPAGPNLRARGRAIARKSLTMSDSDVTREGIASFPMVDAAFAFVISWDCWPAYRHIA